MATQFNSYEKQMNKAKKLDAEKQIFNKVMDAVGVVFGVQSCGSGPVGLFPDEVMFWNTLQIATAIKIPFP